MAEVAIWQLELNDCPTAADLMARAFQDDPFFCTAIPDPEIRKEHLPPFFAACLRYGCHFGRVFAAGSSSDEIEGVAWWYRFPDAHYNHERIQYAGFDEVDNLLGDGSTRIEEISRGIDAEMGRVLPQPRANLDQIGVHPDCQGRGIGSALVQHIVAEAATEGLSVALWTDSQQNVGFYGMLGFGIAIEGTNEKHNFPWWALSRPVD